jgi:SAM-dependent methyltransferase
MTAPTSDPWASGAAYEAYIGRWSRRVAPEFLAWLGIPPGQRWLDVGSGTGVLTAAILAANDPASVVGIDPSEGFVEHARAAVVDARARFAVATAAQTGLADEAVDVVVAGLVLNHVPDASAALAEAVRVVRPGGVVAGYVWDYAEGMQLVRYFWEVAVLFDPEAAALEQGGLYPIAARAPLAAAFAAAGLEAVEVRAIEIPTVFSDFDDYWTPFLGGTGLAPTYLASLGEPAREELRDRLRASLPTDPDGSIRLSARAWAAKGRRPG